MSETIEIIRFGSDNGPRKVTYRVGDWIMLHNRKTDGVTGPYRAKGTSYEKAAFARHCTADEIATAVQEELEAQKKHEAFLALQQTREYKIASRILCMDQIELMEKLGPELLAQIEEKLNA